MTCLLTIIPKPLLVTLNTLPVLPWYDLCGMPFWIAPSPYMVHKNTRDSGLWTNQFIRLQLDYLLRLDLGAILLNPKQSTSGVKRVYSKIKCSVRNYILKSMLTRLFSDILRIKCKGKNCSLMAWRKIGPGNRKQTFISTMSPIL